jgi:hypothetical protein
MAPEPIGVACVMDLARRSNGRPRLEAIAPPTTVHRAAYTAYTVTC